MVNLARRKTRRYRGRTTDELKAERRERLLDTGLALFSERGYANTPIELICSTARVTTRHFYQQFKGREALLVALLLKILEEVGQKITRELSDESIAVADRLTHAVRAGSNYLLDDPRRARIVCIESVGVSPEMEKMRRQIIQNLAHMMQQYSERMAKEGLVPERDFYFPAIALVGATLELLIEAVSEDGKLAPEDFGRELLLIMRALQIGAQQYGQKAPKK